MLWEVKTERNYYHLSVGVKMLIRNFPFFLSVAACTFFVHSNGYDLMCSPPKLSWYWCAKVAIGHMNTVQIHQYVTITATSLWRNQSANNDYKTYGNVSMHRLPPWQAFHFFQLRICGKPSSVPFRYVSSWSWYNITNNQAMPRLPTRSCFRTEGIWQGPEVHFIMINSSFCTRAVVKKVSSRHRL